MAVASPDNPRRGVPVWAAGWSWGGSIGTPMDALFMGGGSFDPIGDNRSNYFSAQYGGQFGVPLAVGSGFVGSGGGSGSIIGGTKTGDNTVAHPSAAVVVPSWVWWLLAAIVLWLLIKL